MKSISVFAMLATLAPLAASAGPNEDKISAEDTKLLLQVTKKVADGCTGCVTPGIDFEKQQVAVQAADLALRDKWITDLTKSEAGTWKQLKERCQLTAEPKVKVDVAVAKLWRVNTLADPVQQAVGTIYGECNWSNPPSPDVLAFVHKVKVIHVTLAHPYPDSAHGYEYAFDAKTGELVIGVHNHPSNIDRASHAWFEKNAR